MEFKGTSGEWKSIRPQGSNGFYYVQTGNGIHAINTATCHNPLGADEDETEVHANAKLIASAPNLLSALQEFIQAVENEDVVIYDNLDHDGFASTPKKIFDTAKAAIEKATK